MALNHRTYQYAALAAFNRERIKRAGYVNGHPIWTAAEDDILRKHYVSPRDFKTLLPHRTEGAIKTRAKNLGLQRRNHVWTTSDVAKLRRLWPQASEAELLAAFPGCTLKSLSAQAGVYKIYKKKRPRQSSRPDFVDRIIERRISLNYSRKDLDAIAGTGVYFQKNYWRGQPRPSAKILKAVYAMGGRVTIHWDD